MLDIRATHYISPLGEVDFASVPLTVHIVNLADETGFITGRFRVYNDTTGLLIFDSLLSPFYLAAGQSIDVSALTDFDPPAPADDTYFVLFDLNASNALVPRGITFSLGAFYFDVKPTGMGPAPAAHHGTHEDGGSDEIDITGLVGNPDPHAASHEDGGSDELSHGDLAGLADDDHPQYRLRHGVFYETDFLTNSTHALHQPPWYSAAIAAGTASTPAGSPTHVGINRFTSSVNANSGWGLLTSTAAILLAGGETSLCRHRPQTLAGTTRHTGFHDSSSVSDPVDGAWIWQDPATGIIYGRTRSNSVGSTTGTGYQLVTNTWYCEIIVVNADASRVDFYLYDDAGALLWTDFLTTNIPTAAGRELGHGFVTTNSGTTAVALVDTDYLSIRIPDRRPDL